MNFYWSGTLIVGMSALFNPIKEAFGLSAATTTLALTSVRQAVAMGAAPAVGHGFDRLGPRWLALGSTLFTAGGLFIIAAAQGLIMLWSGVGVVSIGFAVYVSGIGPAAAAQWFVRHRGRAISIVIAGAGLGGLLTRGLVFIEAEWGWRVTVTCIAVGLLAIGIPGSMLLRHRPEQYGLLPDGDKPKGRSSHNVRTVSESVSEPPLPNDYEFGDALRSPALWLVLAVQGTIALGNASVSLLVIPHLEDKGWATSTAAWVAVSLAVMNVTSILAFGWLSDRVSKRPLLAILAVVQGGSMIVFAFSSSLAHLLIFAATFGLAARAVLPINAAIMVDYYGRTIAGKTQGLLSGTFAGAAALGPFMAGLVFDRTGTYTSVFIGFGIVSFLSAVVVLFIRPPDRKATAAH